MDLFRFLLLRSRRALLLAIAFGLLSGVLNSGLLAIVNLAVSHRTALPESTLAFWFVALWILAPITRVVAETFLIRLGQRAVFSLRVELSNQILGVSLRRLEESGPPKILPVLTDDIPSITNMVSMVPVICINAGVVLSCLAYMGWLNWRLLAGVCVCMVIGVFTYQMGVARAARHFQKAREHDGALHGHFQALLAGIKELKLHQQRREAFMADLLQKSARESQSENIAGLDVYAVASSWGQLLVFTTMGLVVFWLSHAVNADVTTLLGFPLALIYLMTPLQVIMNTVPIMTRANIAIRKVKELGLVLGIDTIRQKDAAGISLPSEAPRLELEEIVYSYHHEDFLETFTLGPIFLKVPQGELLFITGGNGSGKTTLAKLILGLYIPEGGKLLLNGEQVGDHNRESYWRLFSAIFSDCFLFESLLGMEAVDLDARAREYLVKLRLDHKVRVENGVLSTTELSQGQRKRLALLTCCLEDRPVFFFDEWAADQDPTFKEIFYRGILPSLKERGKTVIVISHDERYYDVADRIIHMDSGRITSDVSSMVLEGAAMGTPRT